MLVRFVFEAVSPTWREVRERLSAQTGRGVQVKTIGAPADETWSLVRAKAQKRKDEISLCAFASWREIIFEGDARRIERARGAALIECERMRVLELVFS